MGAAQVAAIDGANTAVGQRLTRPLRLPAAAFVQINVQMALQARLRIPCGFAVAHGGDLGGLFAVNTPDAQSDIQQALLALGYSDKEAAAALKSLPVDVGVSEGIKLALKSLNK